mgnify:CR=1 FL=1
MVAPTDNPKNDGRCIHDAVRSGVEQAECIGPDLLDQITKHQHADQWHRTRHEQGHYRCHYDWEDDLQDTQIFDFRSGRVFLFLLLHIDG